MVGPMVIIAILFVVIIAVLAWLGLFDAVFKNVPWEFAPAK